MGAAPDGLDRAPDSLDAVSDDVELAASPMSSAQQRLWLAAQAEGGRGDFQLILGEFHLALASCRHYCFVTQHPEPQELFDCLAVDNPGPRLLAVQPKEGGGPPDHPHPAGAHQGRGLPRRAVRADRRPGPAPAPGKPGASPPTGWLSRA